MKYKGKIKEIFGDVESYSESQNDKQIIFRPKDEGFTYESLCQLSKLLGTTNINVRPGYVYGYCETCSGYEPAQIIISDIDW